MPFVSNSLVFSIVIPVYNRPDEVLELLESLDAQTNKDFELVIIEDGSKVPCKDIVDQFSDRIKIQYHYIENSGPGFARNVGAQKASGNYILLFDSDCLIPPHYMEALHQKMEENYVDCFGGPDSAHESFSDLQKAIDYAMTSFFTTGGIRGKKKSLDKYTPRSFNMGISKKAWNEAGGFTTIHPGEDPDLSFKIMKAGYTVAFIPETYVYHKRRINFKKFLVQVYKFGVVRIILSKWHPGTFKIVYALPAVFTLGTFLLILLSIIWHPIFLAPIGLFILLIFFDCLITRKNLKIALMAVVASFMQLTGYGYGFLKSFWKINILKQNEKKAFPKFFFEKQT